MNEQLRYYQVSVEMPGVSGFEHLQMLDIRDDLERMKSTFTQEELKVLSEADQRLLAQAPIFLAALPDVANLAQERLRFNPPPSHWWWYLDVLAQLPVAMVNGLQKHTPALVVLAS